jgi:hypothetical protein
MTPNPPSSPFNSILEPGSTVTRVRACQRLTVLASHAGSQLTNQYQPAANSIRHKCYHLWLIAC